MKKMNFQARNVVFTSFECIFSYKKTGDMSPIKIDDTSPIMPNLEFNHHYGG
jgi:hypothetical protein